ncbi:hypothetical protein K474DRAFT_1596379 [Panus rudis PR-1116 ss-1]|nr:hypothetical protein K474DRAFT_1596379 [Panus rudis PR-1116 ss-1]
MALVVAHRRITVPQLAILTLLILVSLYVDTMIIQTSHRIRRLIREKTYKPPKPVESYSLIGTDFPQYLPVEMGAVKIIVEESVHYALTNHESADEWLWTAPLGDNHIRLGDESMRAFAVPMFHQLHCLRGIREAIEHGFKRIHPGQQGHIHHCFNYIRQWTLCSADVTLEPGGDFRKKNYTAERVGATYTCKDWQPLYDVVNERWEKWETFRDEHGIPKHVE